MADVDYYRGGGTVIARPHEVVFDPATGMVMPAHGVSVSTRPDKLTRFGGPYRVTNVPPELAIVQVGRNRYHYEIIPKHPMRFDEYQGHLDKIVLVPVLTP